MGFCKYKVQTQLTLLKKDCVVLSECIYIHGTEPGKAFELIEVTGPPQYGKGAELKCELYASSSLSPGPQVFGSRDGT